MPSHVMTESSRVSGDSVPRLMHRLVALLHARPAAAAWSPSAGVLCTLDAVRFAGHSKWSKIKHQKGDADAKKSAVNTKLSKEIFSAVKGTALYTTLLPTTRMSAVVLALRAAVGVAWDSGRTRHRVQPAAGVRTGVCAPRS